MKKKARYKYFVGVKYKKKEGIAFGVKDFDTLMAAIFKIQDLKKKKKILAWTANEYSVARKLGIAKHLQNVNALWA
ncbi:MAG: hypothetical protein EBZ49_00280 [Proteobacteria bacterium]|nr:hypothetical protein [Pseudomonadota bacterium]